MENVLIVSQLFSASERRDPFPVCWNWKRDIVVWKLENRSCELEDARDSVDQKCQLHSEHFVNREENKRSSEFVFLINY